MANEVAVRKPPTEVEIQLQEYSPQIATALPKHITVERFNRVVLTALNQQPDLVKADRRSLFSACVEAAKDGLYPDGKQAALVLFNTKNKATGEWVKKVQYIPMIEGIQIRARNSGQIKSFTAEVVHEKDLFVYQKGDDPKIIHEPVLTDAGKVIAAYSIAKLTNGEILREVMNLEELEKVRAASKSGDNGPWRDWTTEMQRKSVMKRLAKRLPKSSDLDQLFERDEPRDEPAQIAEVPQRPKLVDFKHPHAEQVATTTSAAADVIYPVVSHDGEEMCYDDAGSAVKAMEGVLEQAATFDHKAIVGVWESNAVLIKTLRDNGGAEQADALSKAYTKLIKPKKSEKVKPDGGDGSNKPVEGDAPATSSKPVGGDAPKAEPEMVSPLVDKKVPWPTWVGWAKTQIAKLKPNHSSFMKKFEKEMDFIATNRSNDWDGIMELIDAPEAD